MKRRRAIRTGMLKAIQGLAEPAEGLGDAWASGMKDIAQAYCNIWQNSPQFIKGNPVGGFVEGAMSNMCNSGDDQPDPPEIDLPEDADGTALPFTGGQCEGDNYTISIDYEIWECTSEPNRIIKGGPPFSLSGPINKIEQIPALGQQGEEAIVRIHYSDGQTKDTVGGNNSDGVVSKETEDCTNVPDNGWVFIVRNIQVTNNTNPDDDCGDPPPPPDAPNWKDPDPEPPQPPPIIIPPPPGYPDDFPSQEINITFNEETKNFEGDKFTIKLQPPDIVVEYDADDPPDFISDGDPDSDLKIGESPPLALPDLEMPQFPDISFPEVIGDGIERITDYIPTPLPGVTVGDIYDEIQDCLGEEDSEPLFTIKIPYYDCEAQAFVDATLEATESSVNNFPLDSFSESAANASLWCDEPEVRIGYPDWWAVRVGANRPQLVIVFRKDATRNYCSLVIPHYSAEPAPETSPLGAYQAGNTMGRETLTDNSKLTVYASNASEANRVLDEMASVVKSEMRYSPPRRTIQERQGNPVEESERIPRVVEVWPEGRATGSAPSKAWKLPPLNEPTP